MAIMDANYNIQTNRGDVLSLTIKSKIKTDPDGNYAKFLIGDVVRFSIMERNNCENIILQKDITIEEECESVKIRMTADEMKIGEIISKPVDYWYEVQVNPDTPNTITILGYKSKKSGPKILTLLPEGGDKK